MERVAGVDDVGRVARVLVGQEPGLDDLYVRELTLADPLAEQLEHHG